MKKRKKGFTLIELLATIFIISIIFSIGSYFMINSINKSKETSKNLTYTNIKSIARIYVEENPTDIIWQQNTEKTNQTYSCISIKTLISKGLLKEDILKQNLPSYVIVTKDNNNNILSESLDSNGICLNNDKIVTIPTSKNYCNLLTYNGQTQILTKTNTNEPFQFINNTGINAGNYEVTAKLSEGYIWKDGTTGDKTITCSIKKAFPILTLNPNGTDTQTIKIGENIITNLTSNIDGTISIKPANKDYITANTTDNTKNITANTPKEITITPLATRNIETTITITITPNDTKNYYSSSTTYTIGKPQKTKVPIPTSDKYCNKNLTYNQSTLTLVKKADTGFNFYNTTATEAGTYNVTAKLQYGYIWTDNSLEDKTITCTIKEATPTITYQTIGGTSCNPNTKTVTYNKTYGELCTTNKTDNIFLGWYTKEIGGTEITQDSIVSTIENHNLYAHWKEYHYLVDDKIYTTTFQEAITVASNNSIIKLMNNYKDTIDATVTKNITFDTNGFTWNRIGITTINSENTLSLTGTGTINKSINPNTTTGSDSLFINKGTLNINYNGAIKYEITTDTSSNSLIHASIDNYGTTYINKATFTNNNTRNISNNKNATLTMTGGSITTNGGRAIHNNGTATIENVIINTTNARSIQNDENGTINIKGTNTIVRATDARAIQNAGTGTITIENGTIDTKRMNTEARVIVNASNGTINIKGGIISGTNERPIQNDSSGTINIAGGTITSTNSNTVYNNSNGKINFSGGTLKSSGAQAIYNNATGTITMTNGTITATGTGIYNNTGTVSISNGNITTTSARIIQNNGIGIVTISGGTLTAKNARGIQNEANGTININGGIITSEGGSTIYNLAGGTIKITNGTLTAKTDSKPVCVYNYGTGTIYISGGKMTATYLSSSGTGSKKAYYNKSTGTIAVSGGIFEPTP